MADLKAALKRCSQQTLEAAIRYRETGDGAALPMVVTGIIDRYTTSEAEIDLASAPDDTRLIEDLGIDSLTMLEIVLTIEEALGIRIQNEELGEIMTLGAVKRFISEKVKGGGKKDSRDDDDGIKRLDRDNIAIILPQNPPFLFVDSAEMDGDTVRAKYAITGDEYFLEGHFPDNPVFPASIVFEALGQVGCLWVLENMPSQNGKPLNSTEVVFASMEDAHFHKRAKPGDVLEMEIKVVRNRPPLAVFAGSVKVGGERLAEIGHLVLAVGEDNAKKIETEPELEKKKA